MRSSTCLALCLLGIAHAAVAAPGGCHYSNDTACLASEKESCWWCQPDRGSNATAGCHREGVHPPTTSCYAHVPPPGCPYSAHNDCVVDHKNESCWWCSSSDFAGCYVDGYVPGLPLYHSFSCSKK